MADSRITISNVSKRFGTVEAVKNATLTVAPGEVVLIIGPSGSGKSTLLRCVNRLETASTGEIYIDDDCVTCPHGNIRKIREEVGMVFQSFNLFPHLTARDNIALSPRKIKGIAKDQAYQRARELLARVGLADKETNYPDELSGGQQQRVAIARALANDPSLILADEPTGNLPSDKGEEILGILDGLNRDGVTIVMVTHDERLGARGSRCVRLRDGMVESDTRRAA